MQTDQDEMQGQGDSEKEAEEKAPRENEEMEVKLLCVSVNETVFTGRKSPQYIVSLKRYA